MQIQTHIAGGLPCIARVASYTPYRRNRRGHPETWLPDDEEDIEIELLTLKGKPAPWMEKRASDKDWERITDDLLTRISEGEEP